MPYPRLVLTYFDYAARAESIRLAFALGNIPFVDERLTQEQFDLQKAAGRFKVSLCLSLVFLC